MAGAYERGEIDSAKTAELFAVRGGAGISLTDYKAGRRGTGGKFPVIGVAGLSLWVRPSKTGFSALWRLRLYRDGKETTKTEKYRPSEDVDAGKTLKEARTWALEIRAAWADGKDLVQERRKERKAKESALPDTIAELYPIWATDFIKKKGYKRTSENEKIVPAFCRHAGDYLGAMRPDDVKPVDVVKVLEPLALEHRQTMIVLRRHLEKFFQWCRLEEIGKRDCEKENPAAWYFIKERMPKRKKWAKLRHFPKCPIDLLPRFFKLLTSPECFNNMGAMALAFQILTASRINNVVKDLDPRLACNYAVWEDIDMCAKVWKIPAHKMKAEENGPHIIPLSSQAMKILERLKKLGFDNGEAVFVGRKGTPLNTTRIYRALKKVAEIDIANGGTGFIDDDEDADKRRAVPHGISRASFRTWGEDTEKPANALESALHHSIKDSNGYNRAKLFKQKQEVLQAWADYLFSECAPDWAEIKP